MSFINQINKKEDSILLEKYDGEDIQVDQNLNLETIDKDSNTIRVCFLDLETTGFDIDDNEIIEIAMKLIEVDKKTGNYVTAVKQYESYNHINIYIYIIEYITNHIEI